MAVMAKEASPQAIRRGTDFDVRAGRLLKAKRLLSGHTLNGVSKKIGLSYCQIQKYELAQNRISIERLCQMGRAIGFDPADFLREVDGRKKQKTALAEVAADAADIKIMRAASQISNPDDKKMLLALARHFAGVEDDEDLVK